ncbi:hypothetical protein QYM36_014352 [Artemia franciscana]|nr:hypothetical protein QYM36_014352 [Artemia franciscana]KAK2708717.1 hypothetical protein QYM36_014352 [Artemia franciscana]KAK2708718.1 hypothetical protein QYM36_014352 [Artemia franciscana]
MDMEAILDFIYTGAVDLDQAQLQSFLSTAEALQIKGLTKADTFQDIDDKNSRLPAPRPTDLDNLSRDSLPAKRPYKESSSSEEEEKNKEAIPLPLTDQNLNNVSSIEDMNIHCEDYGIQLQLPATKYEGDNFPLNASIPLKKRAKTVPVPSVLEKKDGSAAQHKNSIKGCSEFVFNQRIVRGSRAGISKYGLSPDLKCSQCDKVFVHAASLIKHRSFHEGNTVCPFCNRVYSHKYTLREHVIREHGNRAHEVPSIAFKKTASRNSFKEMAFVPKVQSIVKPNLSESGSPDSLLPSLISSEDLSIKKEVAV